MMTLAFLEPDCAARSWCALLFVPQRSDASNRAPTKSPPPLQVLYSTGALTEMLDALDSRHPPTRAMATACMDIVLEFDR